MGKRALLICLLSLFALPGAFSQNAAAQMPGERGVFPENFVKSSRGELTQGGLVILTLQPGARALYEGRTLPQYEGKVALGFGRDAPLEQSVLFTRGETARAFDFQLKARVYVEQRIDGLPPAFVTPPAEALEKIKREAAGKREARSELTLRGGFAEAFIWPVAGRITGVYGSRRFYNGAPRRPHYGIDIAAPAGTPVQAPATGRVTLASPDMYFEGGLIFIDHGWASPPCSCILKRWRLRLVMRWLRVTLSARSARPAAQPARILTGACIGPTGALIRHCLCHRANGVAGRVLTKYRRAACLPRTVPVSRAGTPRP